MRINPIGQAWALLKTTSSGTERDRKNLEQGTERSCRFMLVAHPVAPLPEPGAQVIISPEHHQADAAAIGECAAACFLMAQMVASPACFEHEK